MAMAPANRPLGGLTVGAGGQMLTPQQVAEQRKVAAALMQQASDTSPVGHWTAALNRGLQGYLGGRDMFRANETESNETARALEAFQNRSGMQQPSPVASALAGGGGGFMDSLVNSESGGNWNALNSEGYGGRLQFGEARLADAAAAGIIPEGVTGQMFSTMSPEKQMAVENWHFQDIENQARRMGLDQYVGQVIGGVPITMEAIKGMAHLGGIGGTARFLESGGQYNPADSNGTSLRDYGLRHGGASSAGAGVSAAPASGNVSEIAALLADQWLPPSARAVAEAELQQQMQMQNAAYEAQLQNQDPLRQLQIQQAQLALEAAQNPAAPEPIEINGQLVDPLTYEVIGDYRTQESPSARTAYHDGRLINMDTGEVVQEYASTPDQSAKEQEIDRAVSLGLPRDVATKIADGIYRMDTNPLTGEPQVVDLATMSIVPVSNPMTTPEGTVLDPVIIESDPMPSGAQGEARSSFGLKGAGLGLANTAGGLVGWTPDPQVQQTQADFAVSAERALNDIASSYARQPPSWLLQNVNDLIPRPGSPLVSPDDAKAKFVAIHDNFSRDIESIENQLRTLALSPQGRQELEQNLMAATRGRDAMRQYVYQLAVPGEDLSRFGIQSQQPAAPSATSTGVTWRFVD